MAVEKAGTPEKEEPYELLSGITIRCDPLARGATWENLKSEL